MDGQARYCLKCGAGLPQDATFCARCGAQVRSPAGDLDAPTATKPIQEPPVPTSFTERYAGSEFAATQPMPAPRARSRTPIALAGGVALVVVVAIGAALALRGGPPSTAPSTTVVPTPTPLAQLSTDCIAAMTPLVNGLEDMDSRLSVGLTFSEYSVKVGDLKVVYDKIKPSALDSACLATIASRAESALNDYVHAYNTWNDCIGKASCTNASIKSSLQDDWAKATETIRGLRTAMP